MTTAMVSIVVFFILVVTLAGMRIASSGRFTIESREIVAAVVTVGLGLFVFGEVTEIAYGDVRLVRTIKKAAATPVKERVADMLTDEFSEESLQFESATTEAKGSPELIPKLIDTKATALSFQLGSDYYVGWVVAQYVNELTRAPYLRHLVFNDSGGRLVAIADARAIAVEFARLDGDVAAERLTDWIANADIGALRRLPGFVHVDDALSADLSTREALEKMLQGNSEELPVVDEGRFVGIARRTILMGAILMALTDTASD